MGPQSRNALAGSSASGSLIRLQSRSVRTGISLAGLTGEGPASKFTYMVFGGIQLFESRELRALAFGSCWLYYLQFFAMCIPPTCQLASAKSSREPDRKREVMVSYSLITKVAAYQWSCIPVVRSKLLKEKG